MADGNLEDRRDANPGATDLRSATDLCSATDLRSATERHSAAELQAQLAKAYMTGNGVEVERLLAVIHAAEIVLPPKTRAAASPFPGDRRGPVRRRG